MKKNFLFAGLALIAALTACDKNEIAVSEPVNAGRTVSLFATPADTKTANDGLTTKWVANDALTVFAAEAGTEDYGGNFKFELTDAETGKFDCTGTLSLTEDAYDWYVFYPYTSQIETPANKSKGYVTVGSSKSGAQVQNGNSSKAHLAGDGFPLWGQAKAASSEETPEITMHQVAAVVAVKVTNGTSAPLQVTNVALTAPTDIIGTYYIDFTGEAPAFTGSGTNYVSPTATLSVVEGEEIAAGATATFYLGVKPFTAEASSKLKLTVTANNGPQTIEKTLDQIVNVEPGFIKTFNFTYDQTQVEYAFTSIAELNALATAESATLMGKLDAVVSFVPANNQAIIKDATGSILYYKSSHGLKQGQTYSGEITVTALVYNGLYTELTAIDATFTGEGAVVDPEVVTLADLVGNYSTYQNAYVKVQHLEVTAVDAKNITVKDESDNTYVVYTNFGNATNKVGDVITAVGTVTKYSTTEEIKVWKAADITVENETPSFGVASTSLNVAAAATSAKISVTGNVAWTAVPSTGATVNPGSGEGAGDITVTFDANTSTETAKTYTVTVSTTADVPTQSIEVTITQAAASATGASWVRITSVADLLAGGTCILGYEATANSGAIIPMANEGSATNTAAGFMYSGATAESGNNDTIDMSNPGDTSKFEVTIAPSTSVDGAIVIIVGDYYLGNTNTKNNCKLFEEEAATTAFTPTLGDNDVFTLTIDANAQYTTLQYNAKNPRFAVYGGTQNNLVIYKLSESTK